MKNHLNAKIKFREEFRPFAPVVKEENFGEYFETLGMDAGPFMLFTHRALQRKGFRQQCMLTEPVGHKLFLLRRIPISILYCASLKK